MNAIRKSLILFGFNCLAGGWNVAVAFVHWNWVSWFNLAATVVSAWAGAVSIDSIRGERAQIKFDKVRRLALFHIEQMKQADLSGRDSLYEWHQEQIEATIAEMKRIADAEWKRTFGD
jgi:hypothetical protein